MPAINLQHVVSVSSEDKNCPAENLIKSDSFKKWKCAAGEKNATVTLQFEKASEINQIDIGNEGSAFVEVLVGKSSAGDDSYQVILVSSSFMSPAESRSSQNLNRVRIFGSDALSKAVAGQKWDRIKVVCTQPFNKGVQFGLSFIRLYSTPVNDKTENTLSKQLTLGAFVVKSDEPGDPIKAGSLFEKNKHQVAEPPLTGAAAIRAASKTMEKTASDVAPPLGGAENKKGSKSAEQSSPVAKVKPVERKGSVEQKTASEETKTKTKRGSEAESSQKSPPAKKLKTDAAEASTSKDKPFSQLMKKVVFVLSGFQNPLRGQLRDKAQEMGATYKGDWGPSCTHLLCAFENTPKYNEVRGKGRIVKKEWVVDCHKQKKLLPWRQYRLGRAASPKASDSEEEEVSSRPSKNREKTETKTETKAETKAEAKTEAPSKGAAAKPEANKKKELNEEKKEMKGKDRNGERKKAFHQMSYEGDTDSLSDSNSADESRSKGKAPMAAKQVCVASTSAQKNDEDIFNASTDEEMGATEDKDSDEFPELPEFFGGKCFFLYGDFSPDDRRLLTRYITAYNGLIIGYMDETIDYVITDKPWDENFDQALSENAGLSFVKSSWVHACHDAQRLLPHQKFVITPKY